MSDAKNNKHRLDALDRAEQRPGFMTKSQISLSIGLNLDYYYKPMLINIFFCVK